MTFFVSNREKTRVDDVLSRLKFRRVSSASEADVIWLNTPLISLRSACACAKVYNHASGRAILEDKSKLAQLFPSLESYSFETPQDLQEWFFKHKPKGRWVIKDATANSGYGLRFIDSWKEAGGGGTVAQRYLENPRLFLKRKVQLRCYAMFTPSGCFAYDTGLIQTCSKKYDGSFDDPQKYVTNVSCNLESPNFVPERPVAVEESVFGLVRSLARRASPLLRFSGESHFELCGIDVLFDVFDTPYLVECNCPPNNYGSSRDLESFHSELASSCLGVALDGRHDRWRMVSTVKSPVSKRPRLAHAAAWTRFLKNREMSLRASYGTTQPPPLQSSLEISLEARSHFPYFDDDDERPVFLENAGGSQVCRGAVDASSKALMNRWREKDTFRHRRKAREALKFYFKADFVVLGSNASTLLDALSRKLSKTNKIVYSHGHEANIRPWLPAKFDSEVAQDTELVAMPHASNVTGAVFDIAEMARKAKRINPRCVVVVDGVAFVPHRRFEMIPEVDYYVASIHKMFGPHLAAIVCNSPLENMELGTISSEACAGTVAAVKYMLHTTGERLRLAEAEPFFRIVLFLRNNENVSVVEHPQFDIVDQLPIVSFTHRLIPSTDISSSAANSGVAIRAGDFLAPRFLDGKIVVRVSIAHYNTPDDVEKLIEVLEAIPNW